ncbi:single-stranded DNA-binding protein [Nocardiopsis sediminis]|uniref:Single-stranded DNA-binding protein n=1 Tax=Nocardiopsis sediminis TaxID=1778267 RepID=A0ABV8FIN4_9ACTN
MHNQPFAAATDSAAGTSAAATATAAPPSGRGDTTRTESTTRSEGTARTDGTARTGGGRSHDPTGHRNDVLLAGRITAEPAVRELPSGDHLVTWRISITRPPAERRPNQPADPITCVSFHESMQDATRGWRIGDIVQVSGSLRRRFWRTPGGSTSVIEVEARSVEWMGRIGDPE